MPKTVKLNKITLEGRMLSLLINRFTNLIEKHCRGLVEVDYSTESTLVFIFWADGPSRNKIINKMNDYNIDIKVDIIN